MLKKIMKKMDKKKEKIKMKESQEIKIHYEQGRMIFEVGDQRFFLTEETAGSIFGRAVGIEFERLHGQGETSELRSLENYVRIQRLMRKGLGMDQVAKVLNVSQEKLRQFYAFERGRPHVESWNVNAIENERKRQASEELDFVKEAPQERALDDKEPPTPGECFINLLEIRNLRRQGKSDEQISAYLSVDKKEFSKFMEKNQRYLDLI